MGRQDGLQRCLFLFTFGVAAGTTAVQSSLLARFDQVCGKMDDKKSSFAEAAVDEGGRCIKRDHARRKIRGARGSMFSEMCGGRDARIARRWLGKAAIAPGRLAGATAACCLGRFGWETAVVSRTRPFGRNRDNGRIRLIVCILKSPRVVSVRIHRSMREGGELADGPAMAPLIY